MLDKMTEMASSRVMETLGNEFEVLNLQEIKENPLIHPQIRHYLALIAEDRICRKLFGLYLNPSIGIKYEDIRDELDSLHEKMTTNFRFSKPELGRYISVASKSIISHLATPILALSQFVFETATAKPYAEMLLKLNYFSAYDELKSRILSDITLVNFNQHSHDLILRSEFEDLLKKYQSEIISELSIKEFIEYLSPLFDFCQYIYGRREIPSELLLASFEEMKMHSLFNELEIEFKRNALEFVDEEKLHEIIINAFENLGSDDNLSKDKVEDEHEQEHKHEEDHEDDLPQDSSSEGPIQTKSDTESNETIANANIEQVELNAPELDGIDESVKDETDVESGGEDTEADIAAESDKDDDYYADEDDSDETQEQASELTAEQYDSDETELEMNSEAIISDLKTKLNIKSINIDEEYDLEIDDSDEQDHNSLADESEKELRKAIENVKQNF